MKHMIKTLFLFFLLIGGYGSCTYAITSDELITIHKVTTDEMNSITTPKAGNLVYNTTENTLFFYTGTVWQRLSATGTETIITIGNSIALTGNGSPTDPYKVGE